MFSCVTRSHWKPKSSATVCSMPGCGKPFSFLGRQVHCRMCGYIFCSAHCAYSLKLDEDAQPSMTGETSTVCMLCSDLGYHSSVAARAAQRASEARRHQAFPYFALPRGVVSIPSYVHLQQTMDVQGEEATAHGNRKNGKERNESDPFSLVNSNAAAGSSLGRERKSKGSGKEEAVDVPGMSGDAASSGAAVAGGNGKEAADDSERATEARGLCAAPPPPATPVPLAEDEEYACVPVEEGPGGAPPELRGVPVEEGPSDDDTLLVLLVAVYGEEGPGLLQSFTNAGVSTVDALAAREEEDLEAFLVADVGLPVDETLQQFLRHIRSLRASQQRTIFEEMFAVAQSGGESPLTTDGSGVDMCNLVSLLNRCNVGLTYFCRISDALAQTYSWEGRVQVVDYERSRISRQVAIMLEHLSLLYRVLATPAVQENGALHQYLADCAAAVDGALAWASTVEDNMLRQVTWRNDMEMDVSATAEEHVRDVDLLLSHLSQLATTPEEPDLPAGWEVRRGKNQKEYFYNTENDTATWMRPTPVKDAMNAALCSLRQRRTLLALDLAFCMPQNNLAAVSTQLSSCIDTIDAFLASYADGATVRGGADDAARVDALEGVLWDLLSGTDDAKGKGAEDDDGGAAPTEDGETAGLLQHPPQDGHLQQDAERLERDVKGLRGELQSYVSKMKGDAMALPARRLVGRLDDILQNLSDLLYRSNKTNGTAPPPEGSITVGGQGVPGQQLSAADDFKKHVDTDTDRLYEL